MDYRGVYEDGVVWLNEPMNVPNGTEVDVRPVGTAASREDELRKSNEHFWANKSLDEIDREQPARPLANPSALRGEWPADDDIEEFLRFIREARA